jgi:DnaJ-class molecular chaperone
MSYHIGLDEYPEDQLWAEITSRQDARMKGLCDYCRRRPSTRSCKEHLRHHDDRIAQTPPCSGCDGRGVVYDGPPTAPDRCQKCGGKGIEK